jgi:acyl carrier protein
MNEFIKEQIKALIFRNVRDDEALLSGKVLDSIVVVDLAVALEDHYHVKIPFTDINETNFETVSKIAAYLQNKGAKP